MLNRAVLIVRPKQPYIDWAAGLDDSGLVPDAEDEQTVYLIPSYEDEDEAWEIVEELYETVFENELVRLAHRRVGLAAGSRLRDVPGVVRDRAPFDRGGPVRLRGVGR